MNFKMKLLKNESGSVSVETAFYFVMFFVLCALVADYSIVFINKGRLERINHSLASIVRERTALYSGNEQITQADVDNIKKVADLLMKDTRYEDQYSIHVDAIYFKESKNDAAKEILKHDKFSVNTNNMCTQQNTDLEMKNIISLSPWSYSEKTKKERWSPLYQVSLCVPGENSLFNKAIGNISGNKLNDILIRNVVVPR
ncbi:tight adherence pilus pseudopilin TadF [Escherichia coli]|uniref:tight adherence pilus pseudopilin TadF n=1 Tax=Escherichia coli TaxID=562 RepID=UPI0030F4ADE9